MPGPLTRVAAATARIAFGLAEAPMRLAQHALGVRRIAWIFLAPNLLIFGAFTFLPIVINFYYAFTGGAQLMPAERPYVGAENLATLFDCGNFLDPSTCRKDLFWRAVFNTAKFSLAQVALMVAFSLVTALVLNRKIMGRGFWRGVYFYPVLLSPVVVALIWKWLLQREGVLNAALAAGGATPVVWLNDPSWAFFWVVFVTIWAHMGFYTLILLAGLQAIPKELYDASTVDGANALNKLRYVMLPFLRPFLLIVLVLRTTETFRVFDIIYMLTSGGPGGGTTVITYYAYQVTFESLRFGYGSALSFIIGGICLCLALVYIRVLKPSDLQ